MGVYIYSLRTKSINARTEGGAKLKVHALAYLSRSCTNWVGNEEAYNARLMGAARATWERRGELPEYVYIEEPTDGSAVRRWTGTDPVTYDTPDFDGTGEVVGYLRKVGRKWRIEPAYYEATVSVREGPNYLVNKSTLSAFSREGLLAKVRELDHEGFVIRWHDENGTMTTLEDGRVTFSGRTGAHSIHYSVSSDERILAHWKGFSEPKAAPAPKTAYDHIQAAASAV